MENLPSEKFNLTSLLGSNENNLDYVKSKLESHIKVRRIFSFVTKKKKPTQVL